MEVSQRFEHIDVARGIAILLMVLGHCFEGASTPLNRFILSFHMPLFFVLSGVFARHGGAFLKDAYAKFKSIIIPHFTLALVMLCYKLILWVKQGHVLPEFDYLSTFGYWFLPVLFICSSLFILFFSVIPLKKNNVFVLSLFTILIVVLIQNFAEFFQGKMVLRWIAITPCAFFFFLMGNLFSERIKDIKRRSSVFEGLLILIVAASVFVISQVNSPVKMYQNDYGNFPLFIISSLGGIFVVIQLSKKLIISPTLCKAGKLSIAIYVWNFLVIDIVRKSITSRIVSYVGINQESTNTAITFIISVIILFAIAELTVKILPFIYGMKRQNIEKVKV